LVEQEEVRRVAVHVLAVAVEELLPHPNGRGQGGLEPRETRPELLVARNADTPQDGDDELAEVGVIGRTGRDRLAVGPPGLLRLEFAEGLFARAAQQGEPPGGHASPPFFEDVPERLGEERIPLNAVQVTGRSPWVICFACGHNWP
jgi:hypothetical protein